MSLIFPSLHGSGRSYPNMVSTIDSLVFLDVIKKAHLCFKKSEAHLLENTRGLLYRRDNELNIFGVEQGDVLFDLDFVAVRLAIFQKLNLSPNTDIVQYISGSMEGFSKEGIEFCKHFVTKQMQFRSHLILCDFITKSAEQPEHIAICEELVREITQAKRMLTLVADNQIDNIPAKSLATLIPNLYLVYNQASQQDVDFCADYLTTRAYCFEGGWDALNHLTNLLERRQPAHVTYVYGLISDHPNSFSATRFVREYINAALHCQKDVCQLSQEEAVNIAKAYLERIDSHQKGQELVRAINLFLEKQIWKKLGEGAFLEFKSEQQYCGIA